jgi:hypothetical protein
MEKILAGDWGKEVDKALSRVAALKGDDYVYDDEAVKLTAINMKKLAQQKADLRN